MNKKKKIFISYAREDREAAETIYEELNIEGFEPWMDIKSVQPGDKWEFVIQKAIRDADFILVCLSNNSINKRGFIQKEIKTALTYAETMLPGDIFLIPIRLDDCRIPEPLSHIQPVDLFREDGWRKLFKSLQVGAEQRTAILEISKEISIERKKEAKKHLFIAMPFSQEMEDRFFYGIQRASDTTGFSCIRVDKDSFVGDILSHIKNEIDKSVAVVADLTGANPNVYLEVGYAWGIRKPTILLVQDSHELRFDVRGERCLIYSTIRSLEEVLTTELETLKSKGII